MSRASVARHVRRTGRVSEVSEMSDVDGGECRATIASERPSVRAARGGPRGDRGPGFGYGAPGGGRSRLHRALHPLQLDDGAKELLVTLLIRELLEAVAKVPCRGSGTAPLGRQA